MKTLNNNKGITLVEIIIGIALFAIASVALVQGFVSTANIVNRATLYKNASAAASSSVELQELQSSTDTSVDIELYNEEETLTLTGKKSNGDIFSINIRGNIYSGTDNGDSQIDYKEFVPNNYDVLDIE